MVSEKGWDGLTQVCAGCVRMLPLMMVAGVLWLGGFVGSVWALGGAGVGQEIKALEESIKTPAAPLAKDATPGVTVDEGQAPKEPTEPVLTPPEKKEGFKILKLELRGDTNFLEQTGLLLKMRREVEGQTLTESEIKGIAKKYNKEFLDKGYYIAAILTPPCDYSQGTVLFEVDKGRVGKTSFYMLKEGGTNKQAKARQPYKGRYFSEAQLRQKLSGMKEGEAFNYDEFYRSLYGMNTHPDLTLNTELHVRREEAGDLRQRWVDMDFTVEESLPLHGSLSFANSGTEATGDWRPSATLQYLNCTQHDDILTLSLGPISTDVDQLTSYSGSYYVPSRWLNNGGVTAYGGYSVLDAKDVVEGIDINGTGWFGGAQATYRLIEGKKHMLSISGGAVYRSIEDQLILTSDGEPDYETDARKINLVPLSIAVSYSSARPDALKGRNFVTAQTSAEFEDFAGSSSEEELQSLRANADGSYYIEKLQLARIQTLFDGGKGGDTAGQWLLFAKADGQLASGPLVPAEQKAIGGMDTVRGFPERIVQGDHGVSGCLELRTPLFSTFTRSPYKSADDRRKALNEGKTVDKFQFVTFVDAGYVKYEEALTDTYDYTIASVGAGLRLALTSHAQLRFDWGVPIAGRDDVSSDSTEEVDSGGRYHLSAQVQF